MPGEPTAAASGQLPQRLPLPRPDTRVGTLVVATGVNADEHRETRGFQVTTNEDGADWLTFWRDATAREVAGVKVVTSDAHAGLME